MSIEDYEASRISSRNGKRLPNYNENDMVLDLDGSEDDEADDPFEDKKDLRRQIKRENTEGERSRPFLSSSVLIPLLITCFSFLLSDEDNIEGVFGHERMADHGESLRSNERALLSDL